MCVCICKYINFLTFRKYIAGIFCTSTRVNPEKNCELWLITVCQCGYSLAQERAVLTTDVGNGKSVNVWKRRVYGKSSYLMLNFIINLKLL